MRIPIVSNQFDEIQHLCDKYRSKRSIICFTETWLSSDTTLEQFELKECKLNTSDTSSKSNRVAKYFQQNILFENNEHARSTISDFTIQCFHEQNVMVNSIYNSPQFSKGEVPLHFHKNLELCKKSFVLVQ